MQRPATSAPVSSAVGTSPGGRLLESFVVATPIGNRGDLTPRALDTLKGVAAICAEDTRHTRQLLAHFGVEKPLVALHEHNEGDAAAALVARMLAGDSLALVSDAGTPLISDPGFRLVRAAREAGIAVSAVPGASALIAALSVAGLPSDRFIFEGFLPAKAGARRERSSSWVRAAHADLLRVAHRVGSAGRRRRRVRRGSPRGDRAELTNCSKPCSTAAGRPRAAVRGDPPAQGRVRAVGSSAGEDADAKWPLPSPVPKLSDTCRPRRRRNWRRNCPGPAQGVVRSDGE